MSENGEIYTAGKNFTLPPAVTAVTNSNSVQYLSIQPVHITTNIETAVLSNQLFNLRMCVTASRIWLGLNLPVRGEVSGVRISYL